VGGGDCRQSGDSRSSAWGTLLAAPIWSWTQCDGWGFVCGPSSASGHARRTPQLRAGRRSASGLFSGQTAKKKGKKGKKRKKEKRIKKEARRTVQLLVWGVCVYLLDCPVEPDATPGLHAHGHYSAFAPPPPPPPATPSSGILDDSGGLPQSSLLIDRIPYHLSSLFACPEVLGIQQSTGERAPPICGHIKFASGYLSPSRLLLLPLLLLLQSVRYRALQSCRSSRLHSVIFPALRTLFPCLPRTTRCVSSSAAPSSSSSSSSPRALYNLSTRGQLRGCLQADPDLASRLPFFGPFRQPFFLPASARCTTPVSQSGAAGLPPQRTCRSFPTRKARGIYIYI